MSRIINRSVEVVVDDQQRPVRFQWQGRWVEVHSIVRAWREIGKWWQGEGESTFYTIISWDLSVYELCNSSSGEWKLVRVYD
jgi:hypothetical protein